MDSHLPPHKHGTMWKTLSLFFLSETNAVTLFIAPFIHPNCIVCLHFLTLYPIVI